MTVMMVVGQVEEGWKVGVWEKAGVEGVGIGGSVPGGGGKERWWRAGWAKWCVSGGCAWAWWRRVLAVVVMGVMVMGVTVMGVMVMGVMAGEMGVMVVRTVVTVVRTVVTAMVTVGSVVTGPAFGGSCGGGKASAGG